MNVTQLPPPKRPAPYGSTPPASFDASRPAPHTEALKGAWNDGFDCGERCGYVSGWRWGVMAGGAAAALVAGLVLAAVINGWPL